MAKTKSPAKVIVIITGVIFLLLFALMFLSNRQENETKVFENHPEVEGQPTIGNKDAAVSVVEFGDYKCPACMAWGERIFPQLQQDFLDNDDVSFTYINVFFHGNESVLASLMAEAVYKQDKDAYWTFHKAVYDAQPENHDGKWVTPEKLFQIAESAVPEIDLEQVRADLENNTLNGEIELDNRLVEQFEVEKTPTIIINGEMLEDPFNYDKIKEIIERQIEEGK